MRAIMTVVQAAVPRRYTHMNPQTTVRTHYEAGNGMGVNNNSQAIHEVRLLSWLSAEPRVSKSAIAQVESVMVMPTNLAHLSTDSLSLLSTSSAIQFHTAQANHECIAVM